MKISPQSISFTSKLAKQINREVLPELSGVQELVAQRECRSNKDLAALQQLGSILDTLKTQVDLRIAGAQVKVPNQTPIVAAIAPVVTRQIIPQLQTLGTTINERGYNNTSQADLDSLLKLGSTIKSLKTPIDYSMCGALSQEETATKANREKVGHYWYS